MSFSSKLGVSPLSTIFFCTIFINVCILIFTILVRVVVTVFNFVICVEENAWIFFFVNVYRIVFDKRRVDLEYTVLLIDLKNPIIKRTRYLALIPLLELNFALAVLDDDESVAVVIAFRTPFVASAFWTSNVFFV